MYELTGLPVIVQEFGFASKGEIYTREEALAYLKTCGYSSFEEVLQNPSQLLVMMPYQCGVTARTKRQDEWAKTR